MRTAERIGSFALAVALMSGTAALPEMPTAAAAGGNSMQIDATGGDGTTVDHDGTQGSFTDSVQGVEDSDGDQDTTDLIKSEEVAPQVKSPNKMTKR